MASVIDGRQARAKPRYGAARVFHSRSQGPLGILECFAFGCRGRKVIKAMKLHSRFLTLAVLLLSFGASGCLFRSHKVESNISHAPLLSATEEQLVERLNSESNVIRTLNASVDIATTVGGAKKGVVTQYSEISGYILAEKPNRLRMIGLFPIVRNRAFDMVSNGSEFELWIPPKNQFIIGPTEVTKPASNPLENLRPRVILDALLFRPVQPDDIAVVEARTQNIAAHKSKTALQQPNYELDIISKDPAGHWFFERRIYFDRTNLLPYRQLIYDRNGEVATDARYSGFQEWQGVKFPARIEIDRPQEEYRIGLKILKLTLNQPLDASQFVLPQPPGAQVIRLDGKGAGSTTAETPAPGGGGTPTDH